MNSGKLSKIISQKQSDYCWLMAENNYRKMLGLAYVPNPILLYYYDKVERFNQLTELIQYRFEKNSIVDALGTKAKYKYLFSETGHIYTSRYLFSLCNNNYTVGFKNYHIPEYILNLKLNLLAISLFDSMISCEKTKKEIEEIYRKNLLEIYNINLKQKKNEKKFFPLNPTVLINDNTLKSETRYVYDDFYSTADGKPFVAINLDYKNFEKIILDNIQEEQLFLAVIDFDRLFFIQKDKKHFCEDCISEFSILEYRNCCARYSLSSNLHTVVIRGNSNNLEQVTIIDSITERGQLGYYQMKTSVLLKYIVQMIVFDKSQCFDAERHISFNEVAQGGFKYAHI
jgi:hypothetical protein